MRPPVKDNTHYFIWTVYMFLSMCVVCAMAICWALTGPCVEVDSANTVHIDIYIYYPYIICCARSHIWGPRGGHDTSPPVYGNCPHTNVWCCVNNRFSYHSFAHHSWAAAIKPWKHTHFDIQGKIKQRYSNPGRTHTTPCIYLTIHGVVSKGQTNRQPKPRRSARWRDLIMRKLYATLIVRGAR